jgi:hypothetical protein
MVQPILVEVLRDPEAMDGDVAGVDVLKVEKIPADSQSATAYRFTTKNEGMQGVKTSGVIKGGANDNMIMLDLNLDLEMDFEQIMADMGARIQGAPMVGGKAMIMRNQMQSAVDLKQELIDFKNVGSMTIDQVTNSWTFDVNIIGGDLPAVTYSMKSNEEDAAVNMQMSVTMKDENTLAIVGNVSTPEK